MVRDKLTGEVLAHCPYRIKRADGTYEYGQTDEAGLTHVVMTAEPEALTIEIRKR